MKNEDPQILKYDRGKSARALARERVGQPPPGIVITPKKRKKPKHKKQIEEALQQ